MFETHKSVQALMLMTNKDSLYWKEVLGGCAPSVCRVTSPARLPLHSEIRDNQKEQVLTC